MEGNTVVAPDSSRPFDLFNAGDEFRLNPFDTYKWLRDEHPLLQNADGSYVVSRYEDVDKVLTSSIVSANKSAAYRKIMGDGAILEFQLSAMTTWDPPDHGKIRGLLAAAFTPRAMGQWEPLVRETVDELLQQLSETGKMDLVEDFSSALPLTLICKMLGVPTDNRLRFRKWAGSITTSLDPGVKPDIIAQADQHSEEWKAYFREIIAQRRKAPSNDLISLLLASGADDGSISELTILHNIALLLSAGHETTTNLISTAIDLLLDHPDEAARLRADPKLCALAVEEFLRYDGPVQMGNRRTTKPLTLSAGTVPADTIIWTIQGAANRDEREFRDPDRLNVGRTPNRHLGFATGIHVCLGAPLARLETKVALERVICGFPDLRRDGEPKRHLRTRYRGFSYYPVAAH